MMYLLGEFIRSVPPCVWVGIGVVVLVAVLVAVACRETPLPPGENDGC